LDKLLLLLLLEVVLIVCCLVTLFVVLFAFEFVKLGLFETFGFEDDPELLSSSSACALPKILSLASAYSCSRCLNVLIGCALLFRQKK